MSRELPSDTIDLLQSFLAFCETLNITHAARKLDVSRPTLTRRLKAVEGLCGRSLMERVEHGSYRLTSFGESWRGEVLAWLRQGQHLIDPNGGRFTGLMRNAPSYHGEEYRFQQHALADLWAHGAQPLIEAFDDWTAARGALESSAFERSRRRSIVARRHGSEFLIVEIGDEAPMMDWLGWEWCRSAIGKPLSSTSISTEADRAITYAYSQALLLGTPWYDHVSANLPRPKIDRIERGKYRRLIVPCTFPDGSFAVASIVELSSDLVIDGSEVTRVNQRTGGSRLS